MAPLAHGLCVHYEPVHHAASRHVQRQLFMKAQINSRGYVGPLAQFVLYNCFRQTRDVRKRVHLASIPQVPAEALMARAQRTKQLLAVLAN